MVWRLKSKKAEISLPPQPDQSTFPFTTRWKPSAGCATGMVLFAASNIATALGKIFRYSIKGGSTVKLRDEIEAAKAYIGIQAARFSDKVQVIYHFEPNTLEVPVIKMILQALAGKIPFKYAVEQRSEQTMLYISSSLIDDALVITVYDDGEGNSSGTSSRSSARSRKLPRPSAVQATTSAFATCIFGSG